MASFWRKLKLTLEMIRFEHSLFALPFALTAALLAFRHAALPPAEVARKLAWIVLAMVAARSAAMTFNRLVDTAIDAQNPRTCSRHLPAGLLSRSFARAFFAASVACFLLAAARLGPWCLRLAPVALAVVLLYSYTKRFTAWCHLVLGLALGIAPAAAWIAVTGALDTRILWLTAAVTFWTAGFDIIYACQDFDFDRTHGLRSLPARLGLSRALWLSRAFHLAMVLCLLVLHRRFALGPLALAGVAAIALLLVYEHSLVKPHDLSRVNAAFFTVNGYVSMLFLGCWAADLWLRPPGV